MHMTKLKYTFKLKSSLSELKTLRKHLNHYGKANGLSETCLLDINVCLDELFTNIVLYGLTKESAHFVTFTVKAVGDDLFIDVEDEGIPFNPLKVKDPEIPQDLVHLKIGGLGIYIVKKLMDDVCYKRKQGKNKLTLKKSIEGHKYASKAINKDLRGSGVGGNGVVS